MYADASIHAKHNGSPAFTIGQRVSAHPGTSCFMCGDRYGNVAKVGRTLVHVKMDKSGKVIAFHPANLECIA